MFIYIHKFKLAYQNSPKTLNPYDSSDADDDDVGIKFSAVNEQVVPADGGLLKNFSYLFARMLLAVVVAATKYALSFQLVSC